MAGSAALLYVTPKSFPLLCAGMESKREEKQGMDIPTPSGKNGSENKQLPQETGIRPNPGNMYVTVASVSPVGESQGPLLTPSSAADLP